MKWSSAEQSEIDDITNYLTEFGPMTFAEIRRFVFHFGCSESRATTTTHQLQQLVAAGVVDVRDGRYQLRSGTSGRPRTPLREFAAMGA